MLRHWARGALLSGLHRRPGSGCWRGQARPEQTEWKQACCESEILLYKCNAAGAGAGQDDGAESEVNMAHTSWPRDQNTGPGGGLSTGPGGGMSTAPGGGGHLLVPVEAFPQDLAGACQQAQAADCRLGQGVDCLRVLVADYQPVPVVVSLRGKVEGSQLVPAEGCALDRHPILIAATYLHGQYLSKNSKREVCSIMLTS
jgi:hypothetical protein